MLALKRLSGVVCDVTTSRRARSDPGRAALLEQRQSSTVGSSPLLWAGVDRGRAARVGEAAERAGVPDCFDEFL